MQKALQSHQMHILKKNYPRKVFFVLYIYIFLSWVRNFTILVLSTICCLAVTIGWNWPNQVFHLFVVHPFSAIYVFNVYVYLYKLAVTKHSTVIHKIAHLVFIKNRCTSDACWHWHFQDDSGMWISWIKSEGMLHLNWFDKLFNFILIVLT